MGSTGNGLMKRTGKIEQNLYKKAAPEVIRCDLWGSLCFSDPILTPGAGVGDCSINIFAIGVW